MCLTMMYNLQIKHPASAILPENKIALTEETKIQQSFQFRRSTRSVFLLAFTMDDILSSTRVGVVNYTKPS